MKTTQNERALEYLQRFGEITQLDALSFGCMRLASRIAELRMKGYNIESDTIAVKNRFEETCHVKRYRLVSDNG